MERPPKKYVCEKCGYLGDTSEHEGCDYLAWTTGEQLYIDQLEAELAALRASPASVPECVAFIPARIRKVESGFKGLFIKEAKAYKQGWNDCRAVMLASAPTPPVSEGVDPVMTKEELIAAAESIGMRFPGASIPPVSEDRWLPIETAPKDEFVLLAGPSGYTTIETVFATGRMCSDYHVGRWIDHANDDLTDWGFEPTHWTPLPKAPAMQEDKP